MAMLNDHEIQDINRYLEAGKAQSETVYGFVFVDQKSFEKYRPSTFQSLLGGFRQYK